MSLICKALAGSQLNWQRQEKKKNQPICRGLIRSLAAWSLGHWMMWTLSIQNPLDHGDHGKIYCATIDRERDNFSRWKIICSGLGERQRQRANTDRQKSEGGRGHNLYLCDSKAWRWKVTSCQTRLWYMLPTAEAAGRYTVGKEAIRSTFPEGYQHHCLTVSHTDEKCK